jgi:hypothetical protein
VGSLTRKAQPKLERGRGMSYMGNYTTPNSISVWQTNTTDGKALVYAQTKEGKRLSVLWDKDGNGVVAIDELTDDESDEVFYGVKFRSMVWASLSDSDNDR